MGSCPRCPSLHAVIVRSPCLFKVADLSLVSQLAPSKAKRGCVWQGEEVKLTCLFSLDQSPFPGRDLGWLERVLVCACVYTCVPVRGTEIWAFLGMPCTRFLFTSRHSLLGELISYLTQ